MGSWSPAHRKGRWARRSPRCRRGLRRRRQPSSRWQDGAAFVLPSGVEAADLRHAFEPPHSGLETADDEDDVDRPLVIDRCALPAPSLRAFFIVYRGDYAFSPAELTAALAPLFPGAEVTGAKPRSARWRELRALDPALAWELTLDRGAADARLPFYVRARFDHGERGVPGGAFTRSDLKAVVEFARAFTERIARRLRMMPIELEAR